MEDIATQELFGEEVRTHDKAAKLTQSEQDELTDAVRTVLGSPQGKTFLWWLLNQTHVFKTSFTGNSLTYFLEGERAVGLKIYNQLMAASPTALQELIDYRRQREE